MNKDISLLFVSLVVSTAFAAVQPGWTYQCWTFDSDLTTVEPDPSSLWNPFDGTLLARIADQSGSGLRWDSTGYWEGAKFKIVLEIRNRPVQDPYKKIDITLLFRGFLADQSVMDASGAPFTLDSRTYDDQTVPGWTVVKDVWWIKPNPGSETITFEFEGVGGQPAALDRICVETICTVPEPATVVILGLGALIFLRTYKRVV